MMQQRGARRALLLIIFAAQATNALGAHAGGVLLAACGLLLAAPSAADTKTFT